MTLPAGSPAPPAPVAEIERRIKWPLVAVVVFLAMLAGLLIMAAFAILAPSPPVVGLPDDPDVRSARELVKGLAPVAGGTLRFESGFLAAEPGARPLVAADAASVQAAARLIERARARRPGDPRLALCVAHLDLARRLYGRAERGYRSVLYFGDHCPEGHLGLGVTLALEALTERDMLRARSLELQATAQFAAVGERDAPFLPALYNRALLLDHLGRAAEARRWAAAYLARDPSGIWAARLRERLGL